MIDVKVDQLTYQAHGLTHPGTVRAENEDVIDWWFEPKFSLTFALVADGMGGHDGGAEASSVAAQVLRQKMQQLVKDFAQNIDQLEGLMISALEASNDAVYKARQSKQAESKMGTTIVFAALWNHHLIVLHAGDSRCYVISGKHPEPLQLTRDDSVVQAMLDEGVITKEDVPHVPYRNRLTNALGMQQDLSYSVSSYRLDEGDVVLICSDGFYQAVALDAIVRYLRDQGCSEGATESLLKLSLDNNTDDNTSLILIGLN